MATKKRVSVRLDPYNYDMVKAVADTLFLQESRNEGNFSEALNWILEAFRLNTHFKKLLQYLYYLNRYNRGYRDKKTLDEVYQFRVYLKSVEKYLKVEQ